MTLLARPRTEPWYPALAPVEPTPAIKAACRRYLAAELRMLEAHRTAKETDHEEDWFEATTALADFEDARVTLSVTLGLEPVAYRVGERVFLVAYRQGWKAGREILIRPAASNRYSAGLKRIALSHEAGAR